jgi:hypothetical protein
LPCSPLADNNPSELATGDEEAKIEIHKNNRQYFQGKRKKEFKNAKKKLVLPLAFYKCDFAFYQVPWAFDQA